LEEAPDSIIRIWTGFEEEMIKKYYPTKGAKTLAKILKRSIISIYDKANSLGLQRKNENCF